MTNYELPYLTHADQCERKECAGQPIHALAYHTFFPDSDIIDIAAHRNIEHLFDDFFENMREALLECDLPYPEPLDDDTDAVDDYRDWAVRQVIRTLL